MTIRLLVAYGEYPINAIVTLDAGTEAGLVAAKLASLDTSGGTPYVPPVPARRRGLVEFETGPGGGIGITQIVSLTQAQYDAIVTKDPATLYVIVEG